MSEGFRREMALAMLRQGVNEREFIAIAQFPGLYECQICWAAVEGGSRLLHMEWHDQVHANLAKVQELLEASNDG